jgi:type II secretory pathway pseudopilin PulG
MIPKSKKGFTVLELIVILAVVGFIAAFFLTSLMSERAQSRDMQRISDAKNLLTAIDIYKTSFNNLPKNNIDSKSDGPSGFDIGNVGQPDSDSFIRPLIDSKVLNNSIIETDPALKDESYRYRVYANDENNPCKFEFAILGVKLEHSKNNYGVKSELENCYSSFPNSDWAKENNWLVYMIKN